MVRSAGAKFTVGSLWPFAVLAIAHLVGCLYYFPPREIFSGEPALTGDYGPHFLEAVRMARYLRSGSFWGYCTTWVAGYPDGLIGVVDKKPFVLALAAAPAELQPLVFNLTLLLGLWLFPPLIFATARQLGFDRRASAAAMGLALSAWYGSVMFRVFWRGGAILFVDGAGIALWLVARLRTLWTGPPRRLGTSSAALGASAVLWVHPGAAVVALVGAAAVYVETFRTRGPRFMQLAGMAAVALVTNVCWLVPFVRHADLRSELFYPIYQGGLANFLFDFVRAPLHLGAGPREEAAVLAPLLLGAIVARRSRNGEPDCSRTLFVLAATLGMVAYAGGRLGPLATLQPYRFVIPLAGTLALLAAPLLARRPQSALAWAAAIVVLLVLADRIRIARYAGDYIGAGLNRQEQWALDVLRAHAVEERRIRDGRILLEGDWLDEPVELRPGARRISYAFVGLERYLDAEFFGAPVMTVLVPQAYASFWRGKLFGRDLASYDAAAFLRLSELYDIGWVVTAHEGTLRKLETFSPAVRLVAASGSVAVLRVERSSTRVWRGNGSALADGERIHVEVADGRPVVVKYHYLPLLAASPAAGLVAVAADPESPGRFIEIVAPRPGKYTLGLESPR